MNLSLIVAPFAGAWIEIALLSTRHRRQAVAPFAGAWIEILINRGLYVLAIVAPFAGAWIEIPLSHLLIIFKQSLRSPERGLK